MKDSYSFDLDLDGFMASYQAHRDAYESTFRRLGLPYVIVAAMSGAMGGSASEEFLVPLEVGEDTYVRCTNCDYAANTEAVRVPAPPALSVDDAPLARVVDTPQTPTIQTLVDLLNARRRPGPPDRPWTAADTLKNVVVKLRHPDRSVSVLAIGVPGDREVDMKRLEAQVAPAEIEPFTDDDFAANPTLVRGYIGPAALGAASASGVQYLVDPRVGDGTQWVTGANIAGSHVVHLTAGRDFTPDGTIEAAEVRGGDPCPACGSAAGDRPGHRDGPHLPARHQVLRSARAQRARPERQATGRHHGLLRHRRQPGDGRDRRDQLRRARPDLAALGRPGRRAHRRHRQVRRPAAAGGGGAGRVARRRRPAGAVRRPRRRLPRRKFNDADLLGIPTIVVVGRGLADGVVELKDRRTGERVDVPLSEIRERLLALG